jgi:uncharacterized protein
MKRLVAIFVLLIGWSAMAAEVIPPQPDKYFNDYAHVVSAATADQLNRTLEDFERQTSSQIIVVVYPTMQSDSSIEDYTVRVFRSWAVGQRKQNNGAVLFVFVNDYKMRIATGYGLEATLPDALCKRILDDEITPRFRRGDYDGGMTAGVTAMIAATKGEYKGTGRTVNDANGGGGSSGSISPGLIIGLIIVVIIIFSIFGRRGGGGGGGWGYSNGGFGGFTGGLLGGFLGSGGGFGGGGFGGGGFGGGGFGGGGGGGFSGGGGSTGGGGASGSW